MIPADVKAFADAEVKRIRNTSNHRDWPEDFSHENGMYMNECCECGGVFIGHKRRVSCKACVSENTGAHLDKDIPQ